jgi:hypothetical protein
MKKSFTIFLVVLLLGVGSVGSFLYFGSYESGVMAGRVLRISKKGMLFKTHEGKLSLQSFGALKSASPVAETFDFSVEGDQTQVLGDLGRAALSGERVSLHFEKKYMHFFWRGDTKYFIVQVEREPGDPEKQ